MIRPLLVSFLLLGITACSNVPKTIQSAPPGDTQVNEVLLDHSATEGERVRWGGEIIAVENNHDYSIVQIVQFPLNHYGKPNPTQSSAGRFLARTKDFIDPAVHKQGDLVTFSGVVSGEIETRKVDQKDISMPVIDINESYKWRPYQEPRQVIYYDPFFYPYSRFYYGYGYGPHPRFGFRGYHYFY